MLHSAGNQAIELSAHNSYKYAKMDDLCDTDETALCEPNIQINQESKSKIRKKGTIVRRILIILFVFITLVLILMAMFGAFHIFERSANYKGHKVYKLKPSSVDDLYNIFKLEKDFKFIFWNEPYFKDPTQPVLIQINPREEEKGITQELIRLKINYTIVIEDLQQAIAEEKETHQKVVNETEFDFSRYHTYEEILDYLETNVSKSKLAKVDIIGNSFEGRKIPVIQINNNKENNSKPIIIIDSLIHAKEWVTGATNLFIINELISNKSMQKYFEKFEFHIIPILNPDGYAYCWRTDRLWRKTRSFSIQSPFCRGADANRNFDSHFCENADTEDSSPCGHNYCGDYAFSEPETIAFKDYIMKLNQTNQLKAYFTLHSYKQKLLYPFAYTVDPPIDVNKLQNLSIIAVNAIQSTHGSIYSTGSASDKTSGVSSDWMYEKMNVHLSFALELRDSGHFGHLLPKEMIIPTAEEVWEGIKAILNYI